MAKMNKQQTGDNEKEKEDFCKCCMCIRYRNARPMIQDPDTNELLYVCHECGIDYEEEQDG